jgi:hypothetical protein
MVSSISEPVSLQPIGSSLPKFSGTGKSEQIDPVKTSEPNDLQHKLSTSSLMEASCESEILELELNRKAETAIPRLEIDSSEIVSCQLVSVSEDLTSSTSGPDRVSESGFGLEMKSLENNLHPLEVETFEELESSTKINLPSGKFQKESKIVYP